MEPQQPPTPPPPNPPMICLELTHSQVIINLRQLPASGHLYAGRVLLKSLVVLHYKEVRYTFVV